MSMDKRWSELFARLEAVENELKALRQAMNAPEETEAPKAPAKKTTKK